MVALREAMLAAGIVQPTPIHTKKFERYAEILAGNMQEEVAKVCGKNPELAVVMLEVIERQITTLRRAISA
jgi:hypothetical protein